MNLADQVFIQIGTAHGAGMMHIHVGNDFHPRGEAEDMHRRRSHRYPVVSRRTTDTDVTDIALP